MTVKEKTKKKQKTNKSFSESNVNVDGSSPPKVKGPKKIRENDTNAGDATDKPLKQNPKHHETTEKIISHVGKKNKRKSTDQDDTNAGDATDKPLKQNHATTEKINSHAGKKNKRKSTDQDAGDKSPKKRKRKDGSESQSASETSRPAAKIQHQDGPPDWKQVRADAADIKNRRKAHNKMFEVGKHMKKLWEELRMEECTEDRRQKLVTQLAGIVRGKVPQMVRAHDRVRVCESLFQLGGLETRTMLFEEVRHQLAELSRDKYARHFMLKMLSHATKEQKEAIGASFTGRVTALMGHKFGSEVGEAYFRDCASPDAQQRMLMEFYGTEFLLKAAETRTLEELCKQQPEKKTIYLTNVRSQLQSLLDKQLLTGSLAHRLLREYLSLCPESDRADVIESLREAVVQMLHTKDGARVGLMCLWWGTTKDRKAIVKSMKTYVQKVCVDEHGYMVMLALLDVVDDTRLVKKALLEEMMANIADIIPKEHGRKVLHYLLSPRDTVYFHPQLVATLAEGDKNTTSKKDPEVRRRELREAVSEPLLKTASIHCLEWMANKSLCVLLTQILCRCTGASLYLPLTQLARRTAEPVTSASDSHLVNNSAAYMQLKKVVQADKERATQQNPVLFSTRILKELSEDAILSWIGSNRTAFLLIIMLETEVPAIVETVVQLLQPHVKKLKPACKGAEILKKKVSAAAKQLKTADSGD